MDARYGLIGRRLPHSWSPRIHALLGGYDYALWELEPDAVEPFFRERAFSACNVTIPYKETVIPFLDELDDSARAIGSVNTVVKRPDGTLTGYNTDGFGFRYMLESAGLDPAGRKVAVLGSGGTAKTACFVCRSCGAREIVTVSRSGPVAYENAERYRDAQLLINCTPVGMYPGNLAKPVDLGLFDRLEGVADVIYNPKRTLLAMDAERRGLPVVTGLSMLVAQAKRASELFTGSVIPDDRIDRVTRQVSFENSNLVLIGMPGSGKTTVGKALASRLGREFIDTDEVLERELGMRPGKFIETRSEKAFRERETAVMERYGKEKGLVVATGGGLVTTPRAADAARQNAVVVFLDRPLEMLATSGRPLSKSRGVEALWRERETLYRTCCDVAVDASGGADEVAGKILEAVRV